MDHDVTHKTTHTWIHRHKRATDFIVYIAIGLTITSSMIIATVRGASWTVVSRIFFLEFTAMIFLYYFLKDSKRLWYKTNFWIFTAIFETASSIAALRLLALFNGPIQPRLFGLASFVTAIAMYFIATRLRNWLFPIRHSHN